MFNSIAMRKPLHSVRSDMWTNVRIGYSILRTNMFFIFSILLIPGCLSANVALTNGKFSHDSWRRHVTMNVNDKHWVFSHFSNFCYKMECVCVYAYCIVSKHVFCSWHILKMITLFKLSILKKQKCIIIYLLLGACNFMEIKACDK